MHQPESSILPDVFDSSAISEYRNMKHLFASSFQRMSNMDDGVRTQDPPINGHTNHTFVQHHVNPGSYVSAEDRAYFEQIQDEELAQKDIKIVECQEEIRHLQKQLQHTKQHARLMESINNDLESRLEQMAKDRILANNKFYDEKKVLGDDRDAWKEKHEKEVMRTKNLEKTVRQLEKELYMMHLRKYDIVSRHSNGGKNSENGAASSSIVYTNEDAIASLNRPGGLPSPIPVHFLNSPNQDIGKETVESKIRKLEEEAARSIVLKRTNSTVDNEDYDPVADMACELSRQRGRGKMVKELYSFFGGR
eukprot:g5632.t1